MKISRFNLSIFQSEVETLQAQLPGLIIACKDWNYAKDNNYPQYDVQLRRNKLERELMEFRQKTATIYDFMGDRGLVNFIPSTNGADNSLTSEPEEREVLLPEYPCRAWKELASG